MSTKRDWLDLLPRDAWPEPWRSMGTAGAAPLRPNDIPDPEAEAPTLPVAILVPVLDSPDAALRQVEIDLRTVQETWQAKKSPKPKDRQFAVWSSVKIVSDFIEAGFPDGHELVAHLAAIRVALVNLQAGRAVDWLMPATIGGKPAGVNIDIGTLRGRYASIVELLHRQNRPIREAARDVKRLIPDKSPVWGSGEPSWEAVKRWRDYDCKVEKSAEKESYEAGLALTELFPGLSPIELLRRMS